MHDGFVLNFMVYTGQESLISDQFTCTEKVMKEFIKDYVHKGYWRYMDNFYNSIKLVDELIRRKIYVSGTLRENQNGNST